MFDGFGPQQLLIVVAIILLLFGGSRIPELMRGMGSGIRQFKKGLAEDVEEPKAEPAKPEPAKSEADAAVK